MKFYNVKIPPPSETQKGIKCNKTIQKDAIRRKLNNLRGRKFALT